MREEPALPEFDPAIPVIARVYDAATGGKNHLPADREVFEKMRNLFGRDRWVTPATENRRFLRRAVRYLLNAGVRQFIDIGCGMPSRVNVHDIVHGVDPTAKVVYIDYDPLVVTHYRALVHALPAATVFQADVRQPENILSHPELTELIDFAEPVVHNLRYYYLTSWMADNQSKVGHFLRQITYKPRQNRRFKRLSLIWDVGSALWTHWGRPTWKKIGVPYCLRMLRGRDQQEADRIYNETIDMLQRGDPEGEERLRFVVQGIVTGYLLCNRETMILAMEIMESKGW